MLTAREISEETGIPIYTVLYRLANLVRREKVRNFKRGNLNFYMWSAKKKVVNFKDNRKG
jgi:uncharacterized membrane protein